MTDSSLHNELKIQKLITLFIFFNLSPIIQPFPLLMISINLFLKHRIEFKVKNMICLAE